MAKPSIPRKVIYRLSLYQRSLEHLKANKIATVSSPTLAKVSGVKPPQLRKDLACVGPLGTRGLGYDVARLSAKLKEVLGTARLQPVVLVGVGNLGAALLRYQGFAKEGFEIVAAFDADPSQRRMKGLGVRIFAMNELGELIRARNVKMAILAVPATAAQEVANELFAAGIQGVLNFSPTVLQAPEGVIVSSVDLAIELENLSYFIR